MTKKHVETDESMAAAGLGPEEIAALEEEEAEGTDKESGTKSATDKTDGDGAAADSKSEVLPQVSDDKKAGAVADQPKADDKKVDAAADKDADDKGDKDADDKGDKDDKDDKGDGEAAAADESASADDAAAADESALPPPVGVDSFHAQLAARGIPEDYEAQLTAANEAVEALDNQLAEGEIDYAAHAKQNRELTTTLSDLSAMKREAEFVVGNNELMADQHWNWEVERFVEENEQFKNPVVYGALRGALEELYADEENAGNAYRWFLREAASSVQSAFNLDSKSPPVDKGTKTEEVSRTEEIQKEHAEKPQEPPPKTLANIPAASETEESTDEFAQLDKMEGMELEAELSKLPKAKVDLYLDSRNF